MMISIILKDGSKKEFQEPVSLAEAAKAVSNSLGKSAVAAKVNGHLTDLREDIQDGSSVEFLRIRIPKGCLHSAIPVPM